MKKSASEMRFGPGEPDLNSPEEIERRRRVTAAILADAKVVTPESRHRAFRDDAIALLKKHAGSLDAKEMLALAAHLVGQIIAMQDQRTVSREIALEIVTRNIEVGNAEVLAGLSKSAGAA